MDNLTTIAENCSWLQASVDWCEGRPEYAGVRRRLYFTAKNNIVKFPVLKCDSKGRPVSAVLEGDYELKEGAFWYFVDIVPERTQMTSDSQGDAPSQTSLNKATMVHPGVGEEASMLAAYCHNSNNIYIFEDIEGRAHVIGCEEWPIKSTVAQDFGQGATGNTSTTITVEATDKLPFPRYIGKLHTELGDLQCMKLKASLV